MDKDTLVIISPWMKEICINPSMSCPVLRECHTIKDKSKQNKGLSKV